MSAEKMPDYFDALGAAAEAIRLASLAGFVLTIHQEPQQPLAMGNYVARVSLRKAQHVYKAEMAAKVAP